MSDCGCIERINEALEPYNVELDIGTRISLTSGNELLAVPDLKLRKIDTKKRTRLQYLFATYCPFCGEKYPVSDDNTC